MSNADVAEDLALIKQWMELVNEFMAEIAKMTGHTYYMRLPKEADQKIRLMHNLVNGISIAKANRTVPLLYTCRSCGHQFDHPSEVLMDYHKVEYLYICPKCKGRDFTKTVKLEPTIARNADGSVKRKE